MTRKVYRTAQGRMIDLGALQLQNENVRAVGNMSVNARGDLVDADNRPIRSRNDEVKRQYHRQLSNVTHDDVPTKAQPGGRPPRAAKPEPVEIPAPPEDFDDAFEKPTEVKGEVKTETSGLAAAIARAREIKQEPLRHPRDQTNVKRI